jgi:DNA-binding MarR family transcriptional regulator
MEWKDGASEVLVLSPTAQSRPPASRSAGLRPAEMRAWRAFLVAHSRASRRLEDELIAEHDLPLAWYDVLVQLAEAPDRRLRMSDLAGAVLLSRSGVTRLVDRLEREGLVDRIKCRDDARGTFTVLTEAGLARLREASGTHLDGVRRHVTGRFTDEELETFAQLMERLLD